MIPARFAAGDRMKRFVEGIDRGQSSLFPECVEDWIDEDNHGCDQGLRCGPLLSASKFSTSLRTARRCTSV